MSESEDTDKNYYVAVKLFSELTVNRTYRAHDLLKVSESLHLFQPFRPENLDFDPKQKFGVIRGDRIHLLNILKMSVTREDLDLGRTIAPKRKSLGNETVPLKKYKQAEEGLDIEEAKKAQNRKNKLAHAYKNDDKMMKDLDDAEKQSSKKRQKKVVADKLKDDDQGKKTEDVTINNDDDDDKDSRSAAFGNGENDLAVNGDGDWMKADALNDNGNVVASSLPSSEPSPTEANQSLTPPACSNCVTLREENEALQKQLQSAQFTSSNMLSEIREQIIKVPELVRVFSLEKQFLKDKKFVVKLEKGFKHLEIKDDEVYCGNGNIVSKFDIYDVTEQVTLGKRVARLCDLFWGAGNIHCHFLSGKCARAPPDMQIIKITDAEIKAMKRILKEMSWEGMEKEMKKKLNEQGIRNAVKHYTSESFGKFAGKKRTVKKGVPLEKKDSTSSSSDSSDSSDEDSSKSQSKKGKKNKKKNKKKNQKKNKKQGDEGSAESSSNSSESSDDSEEQ